MQMQEDEIQLLKMALADVLKRLNISEEHQAASAAAAARRAPGGKGEQRWWSLGQEDFLMCIWSFISNRQLFMAIRLLCWLFCIKFGHK